MARFATAKRILVGKLETTAGTAESLADSDYDVRCRGIEITPELNVDDEASKFATGDYLEDESVAGQQALSTSFMAKFAPSDTPATVEPNWWKFLKGCGMVSKAYTTTGVALQDMVSGDLNTMTIGSYDIQRGSSPSAIGETMAGAMGNAVISVEGSGGSVQTQFDFGGKFTAYQDVINANIPVLTGVDTAVAQALKGATITIGGVAVCLQNFSIDLGNSIENINCPTDATGIEYKTIGARAPRATISILKKDVATYDILTKWQSESVEAISIAFGDFTIAIPRAQITTWSNADESGSVAQSISFKMLRNGGADSDIDDSASMEILQGSRT